MKEHLFKIHHKIYLKLNAICQEAGDMNLEEFLKVYEELGNVNTKANIADDSVHEIIELKNVNKLSHERIIELESNLSEAEEKIEQLEEAVAKYDFLD